MPLTQLFAHLSPSSARTGKVCVGDSPVARTLFGLSAELRVLVALRHTSPSRSPKRGARGAGGVTDRPPLRRPGTPSMRPRGGIGTASGLGPAQGGGLQCAPQPGGALEPTSTRGTRKGWQRARPWRRLSHPDARPGLGPARGRRRETLSQNEFPKGLGGGGDRG